MSQHTPRSLDRRDLQIPGLSAILFRRRRGTSNRCRRPAAHAGITTSSEGPGRRRTGINQIVLRACASLAQASSHRECRQPVSGVVSKASRERFSLRSSSHLPPAFYSCLFKAPLTVGIIESQRCGPPGPRAKRPRAKPSTPAKKQGERVRSLVDQTDSPWPRSAGHAHRERIPA